MADQSRTIRLPVHLVEQVNKLARIKREMHQNLGREATDEELAAESGIPIEKINDLLEHSRDPVSLDMPVGSEEEAPLGDFIEDAEAMSAENAVIAELLHTDIRSVLATLDEREHQVIRLRFGLDDGQPRTLDQIGKLFGLSRERVRQIERDVMSKLRNGERADRLRSYAS
jgi:RNA polymerase nonessential primary-like sigma factor